MLDISLELALAFRDIDVDSWQHRYGVKYHERFLLTATTDKSLIFHA